MSPAGSGRRGGWAALAVTVLARGLLGLLASLVLWSLAPMALGWQTSVVMTGSMAPALSPGDVAVARPATSTDLRLGQVLLVDDPDRPGRLRLHRLVAFDQGRLVLKGDANQDADSSTVDIDAVHGVAVLRVPAVGLPFLWADGRQIVPLASTGAGLLLLVGGYLAYRPAPDPVDAWAALRAGGIVRRRRRSRLWWRRAQVVSLLSLALVVVQAAAPAHAVYDGSSTTSASFGANAYYRCTQAAGASSPLRYWALQESSGSTAADSSGNGGDGTLVNGATASAAGPRCGTGGTRAITLNGSTQYVNTTLTMTAPTTLTVEIWFRTATANGGRMIGLGIRTDTTLSGTNNADRHLYMGTDGRIGFGVIDTSLVKQSALSTAAYNDNAWHLATGVLDGSGIRLYVDGTQVGSNASVTSASARTYTGGWRIGWDRLAGWSNAPTNLFFGGSLAHAAVYPAALTPAQVLAHYHAGR